MRQNNDISSCKFFRHHRWSGTWSNVLEDIDRYLCKSPENIARGKHLKYKISAFFTPEILCLFFYRMSHFFMVNRWPRLAWLVMRFNQLIHKVNITPQSCIGPGCRLPHPPGVVFHGRAGEGVTLFSLSICCANENSLDGPVEDGPSLGNRVQVGAHSVLMGPICVGNDCKIYPQVVLKKDAPDAAIVAPKKLQYTCRSIDPIDRPIQ